ncbi:MAG: hypothetical protein D6768_07075 [Chloroflexi bacterium]|nr:MAG: hypothetical protein D6768_07075 [Chloroflexota bacterium]
MKLPLVIRYIYYLALVSTTVYINTKKRPAEPPKSAGRLAGYQSDSRPREIIFAEVFEMPVYLPPSIVTSWLKSFNRHLRRTISSGFNSLGIN